MKRKSLGIVAATRSILVSCATTSLKMQNNRQTKEIKTEKAMGSLNVNIGQQVVSSYWGDKSGLTDQQGANGRYDPVELRFEGTPENGSIT